MFLIFVKNDNTLNFKFISFLFCLVSFSVFSQETIFEEKTTVYVDEYSGGLGLHTNGFSLNFKYGRYMGAFKKQVYEIEFATLKHPKEIKTISRFEDDVKGYVFGKLNSFFTFRPSVGIHNVFIPKQSIRGVSITYFFHLGPSLGLAKPVYLNIREPEENSIGFKTYNIVLNKFDPDSHDKDNIYGKASFFNGVSETKLYPGIFTKFGLEFEYSSRREAIRAIEVGLTSDFYFQKIPIMAFAENRSWFLNLFVGFSIGQKETK